MMNGSLELEDFARLFGMTVDDFDDECREFIAKTDFRYNKVSPERRDEIVIQIIKKIDSGQLKRAGKEGKDAGKKAGRKTLKILSVLRIIWLNCGFSAEVAARVSEHCFSGLKLPVSRIGFAPTQCPTTGPLENKFCPNAIEIIKSIESKLKRQPIDLSNEEFYSYENKFRGPI